MTLETSLSDEAMKMSIGARVGGRIYNNIILRIIQIAKNITLFIVAQG